MFEDRYIGEIVMASWWNRVPANVQECNGQLLPVSQYIALYSLIGNQFGGDGRTTFALPDFRGVFPMGSSASSAVGRRVAGNADGVVLLQPSNIPQLSAGASLNKTWNLDVNTVVKARQIQGTATPSDGFLLGEGGPGLSSATIYVSPATPGSDVELGGVSSSGTVTATADINVTVGSATPSTVSLPSLAVRFFIITTGLFPTFD